MKFKFGKYIMYGAIVIWLIMGGSYMTSVKNTPAVAIGRVFEERIAGKRIDNLSAYIEGYGKFGVCYLDEQEKSNLLTNIARELGVYPPYDVQIDMEKVSTLSKESDNGSISIRLITNEIHLSDGAIRPEQYVYVVLNLKNHIDSAMDYKDLLDDIFTRAGINGRININLVGQIAGPLNLGERNEIADEVLTRFDATVVAESRSMDMYTIYAYSAGINDCVTIGNSKINLNIAMNYDEDNCITNVYVSTPVNSLDY